MEPLNKGIIGRLDKHMMYVLISLVVSPPYADFRRRLRGQDLWCSSHPSAGVRVTSCGAWAGHL
jgi:hypothetical protein